jgi:hypothetical protein
MDTSRSLEDFGEALRRRFREQELRERLAALAVLREYFVDHAAIGAVERLTAVDLTDFALRWLLRSEDADPENARLVLATLGEWIATLPRLLGEAAARDLAALAARLERDVSRALTALQELRAALNAEALPPGMGLEDEAGDVLEGSLTAGVDRLVPAVDYETADQDEFVVQSVEEDWLTLRRAVPLPGHRDDLAPVRAPAGAAERLRPGDILNLELVRDAERWEILEVLVVYPGGYAEGG